jgi:hypothetical protein
MADKPFFAKATKGKAESVRIELTRAKPDHDLASQCNTPDSYRDQLSNFVTLTFYFADEKGLEPLTIGLTSRRSSIELFIHSLIRRESNSYHSV